MPHRRMGPHFTFRCAVIGVFSVLAGAERVSVMALLVQRSQLGKGVIVMLGWALTFLIIALIAAAFGAVGIAGVAATIGWILFAVFLVLFVITVIANMISGRRTPYP